MWLNSISVKFNIISFNSIHVDLKKTSWMCNWWRHYCACLSLWDTDLYLWWTDDETCIHWRLQPATVQTASGKTSSAVSLCAIHHYCQYQIVCVYECGFVYVLFMCVGVCVSRPTYPCMCPCVLVRWYHANLPYIFCWLGVRSRVYGNVITHAKHTCTYRDRVRCTFRSISSLCVSIACGHCLLQARIWLIVGPQSQRSHSS